MSTIEGWIIDANVDNSADGISIWIKQRSDGKVINSSSDWKPFFYVYPKNSCWDVERLVYVISQHPHVSEVETAGKYVNLGDRKKRNVIRVKTNGVNSFQRVRKDIEKLGSLELCNVDIPLEQMFFFSTQLFPFAYVSLTADDKGQLKSYKLLDSRMEVDYEVPILRRLVIIPQGKEKHVLSPIKPMKRIILKIENGDASEDHIIENGCENELLMDLSQRVSSLDPDVILSYEGDAKVFPYLQARVSANQLEKEFSLSRDGAPLYPNNHRFGGGTSYFSYGRMYYKPSSKLILHGRLHIDKTTAFLFEEGGLDGLIEASRLSLMPIQQASRMTVGHMVTSMQNYQAWIDDVLIPAVKRRTEEFKTGVELIRQDRGGLVFEPKMGFHEDVAECDFFMMYPSIMHHFNVSPETVNCKCCKGVGIKVPGIDLHVCRKRTGLVSKVVKILLEKRRAYKKLLKEAEGERKERFMGLQATAKWGGVVSFGYLGFKGYRFGKIDAHIAVTAFAREILLKSSEIAQKNGFDVIHGIVDSLWLKKKTPNANLEDYEKLSEEISKVTGLQLKFKGIYKWIVFLHSTTNPDLGVLNRYYGVFRNGKIRVRGLEVRKHDTPRLIYDAQMDMIKALSDASNLEQFVKVIPKARQILQDYINRVRKGNVDLEDLIICRRLSRDPSEYTVVTRQAAAAQQLKSIGIRLQAGQKAKFVILNSSARNPARRVLAAELLERDPNTLYDKEEYTKLLQRAFDNMFPPYIQGIDRKSHVSRENPGLKGFPVSHSNL